MSAQQQQQQQQQKPPKPIDTSASASSFGAGPDAELAARLAAPVSPTTEKTGAEARRRTSEWAPPTRPPPPAAPGRAFSFDREDHKHAMMAASGALAADDQGFTERA